MWTKHGLVRFSRPTECSSTSKILHRESDNIATNESALIPSRTLLPQSQDIKADKPLPVLYLFIYLFYLFFRVRRVHYENYKSTQDDFCDDFRLHMRNLLPNLLNNMADTSGEDGSSPKDFLYSCF